MQIKNIRIILSLVFIAVLPCGCATYRPMPLTEKTIAQSLKPPGSDEIRIRAASIRHPVLEPVQFNDKDGLSPDEAAILAVIANPTLRAARDQRGIARAQLLEVGILPNPQLSYSFESPVGADTSGKVNAFGLGLGWDISSLVIRAAETDAAKAHAAGIDLDVAWKEWQVAEAAKLGIYRLVIAKKKKAVADRLLKVCKQSYEIAKQGVRLGVLTKAELLTAASDFQEAKSGALQAQAEAEQRRLALNRALGLPADQIVFPQNSNCFVFQQNIPAEHELIAGLEKHRLDLLALKMGYKSQEAKLRSAVRAQFPRINIGFSAARDTDDVKTAGAGLNIDLPFFDRNQGRIAVERATRRQLFDEYSARLFNSRADISRIVERFNSVRKQMANLDESIAVMKTLVEAYKDSAEQGRKNILIYYRAAGGLYAKQLKKLAAEGRLADLAVALEVASGRYIFTSGRSVQDKTVKTEKPEVRK